MQIAQKILIDGLMDEWMGAVSKSRFKDCLQQLKIKMKQKMRNKRPKSASLNGPTIRNSAVSLNKSNKPSVLILLGRLYLG